MKKLITILLLVPILALGQAEKRTFTELNIGIAAIDGYDFGDAFPGASLLFGQTFANNNLVTEFDCGVSPGTVVFDVRNTTSIEDYSNYQTQGDVFFDLSGRKINQIENQPNGVYIRSGKKIFRR